MKQTELKYLTSVGLFGTIGVMLHYISLPSEVVVITRGVLSNRARQEAKKSRIWAETASFSIKNPSWPESE